MSDLPTSIRTRLTATPSKATLGFFDRNLVIEKRRRLVGVLDGVSEANAARRVSRRAEPANQYPYVQAVADGVNVGYDIYRIKTRVSGSATSLQYAVFTEKTSAASMPYSVDRAVRARKCSALPKQCRGGCNNSPHFIQA